MKKEVKLEDIKIGDVIVVYMEGFRYREVLKIEDEHSKKTKRDITKVHTTTGESYVIGEITDVMEYREVEGKKKLVSKFST